MKSAECVFLPQQTAPSPRERLLPSAASRTPTHRCRRPHRTVPGQHPAACTERGREHRQSRAHLPWGCVVSHEHTEHSDSAAAPPATRGCPHRAAQRPQALSEGCRGQAEPPARGAAPWPRAGTAAWAEPSRGGTRGGTRPRPTSPRG